MDCMAEVAFMFGETLQSLSRRKRISSKTRLFWEGGIVEHAYGVLSGAVKAVIHPTNGKRTTLFYSNAGEMIGDDQFTRDSYRYTAIVAESGEFLMVERDAFLREMRSPQQLASLSRSVDKLIDNMERLAIPSAEERTMNFLRSIACESGFARVKGRIREFSDLLHLTPETIYRTLKKLENRAEIERLSDGDVRLVQRRNQASRNVTVQDRF